MEHQPRTGEVATPPQVNCISIATLNTSGIKSNATYVQQLTEAHTIVCLQEHWLHNYENSIVSKLLPNSSYSIKCHDDDESEPPSHRKRGVAGVITLWPKKLDPYITPLPDGGTRMVVIQIRAKQNPITIINTYMPAEGSHDRTCTYDEVLDEVQVVAEKYKAVGSIVWTGDLNADLSRVPGTTNDRKLKLFCQAEDLKIARNTLPVPTYYHFNGTSHSVIDHIIEPGAQHLVQKSHVHVRPPENCSDHDSVHAVLNAYIETDDHISRNPKQQKAHPRPKWEKADLQLYHELTSSRIATLVESGGLELPAQVLAECLQSILYESGKAAGAVREKPNKKHNTKYPWSKELKPLAQASKDLHQKVTCEEPASGTDTAKKLKSAKQALRSGQRQLAAVYRKQEHQDIMEAHSNDKNLFFKLVSKHKKHTPTSSPQINFKVPAPTQLEGWANYFESLATPVSLPHYEESYLNSVNLQLNIMLQHQTFPQHEITQQQVHKHIANLKKGKAADLYGLTAEHLQHASDLLITTVTKLVNDAFNNQCIPAILKPGQVTPVHKKGKPLNDPDGHRRITVTPILGKIIEKEQLSQTKASLKHKHSKLQFGFTDGCSSTTCAFILTEAISEAKDTKEALHIVYMDAKKAFDVVCHPALLVDLHHQGLGEAAWGLFADMYSHVTSRVKYEGDISREVVEKQGIRQGADTSTEAFKTRADKLITGISDQPDAYHIGSISVGAPTCADDTCIVSSSIQGTQALVNIAQHDASLNRYEFSSKKTRVMHINCEEESVYLNGAEIQTTVSETHLGIQRTSNARNTETIESRIKTGRRTSFKLMGAGMYGFNGISPAVSISIVNIYVTPAVMHSLESLILEDADYATLEVYYRKQLRQLQHLPQSTANEAVYLLLGVLPMQAQHHIKVLTFFANILRRNDSVEREILLRQLAMKDLRSNSWTTQVRLLLDKYNLPNALHIAKLTPRKMVWKRTVKMAITQHWEECMKTNAEQKPSLQYLNQDLCVAGQPHPIWQCGSDPAQVHMAHIQTKMLVQRYPLHAAEYAGKRMSPTCPLCNGPPETTSHFLLECPAMEKVRAPHMRKVTRLAKEEGITPSNQHGMTSLILNPSANSDALRKACRMMCFSLHNERAVMMDVGINGRGSGLGSE